MNNQLIELRIALEALYLKGVAEGEMSFRLATRGAWHLGGDKEERARIQKTLKETYNLASAVVHTRQLKGTVEQQRKVLEDGQEVCRKGILKVVTQGEPNWGELILGSN